MKRLLIVSAITAIVFYPIGCAQKGTQQEIIYKKFMAPDRVLVLLLPPITGDGSHYEQYGFIEAVREKGFETDLKILDVNPILYLQGRISEVVKTELVDPAKAAGYNKILLVGISLGGHGALLYATKYPHDVDGVVVLAPFLGGLFIDDVIKDAGGLDKWENCPRIEWDYACDMWKLLKDYLATQENRDKIIIGYGLEDGFAKSNKLLADQLPATNVFAKPGGHDWVTWKSLWIDVLNYFHTSCSASGSKACLIEVKKVSEAELD
jgi:enterochelin esterase-like enzyme